MGDDDSEQPTLFDIEGGSRTKPAIHMSLSERPHLGFLSGAKKYEYRRRFLRVGFDSVIYISRPTCAIAALSMFGPPIVGTSDQLSKLEFSDDPVGADRLRSYLGADGEAVAFPMIRYVEIPEVALSTLRERVPGYRPPQNYSFLRPGSRIQDLLEALIAHKDTQSMKPQSGESWVAELIRSIDVDRNE